MSAAIRVVTFASKIVTNALEKPSLIACCGFFSFSSSLILEKIKTLKDKKGWIVNYPTKFSWDITRNEFINNYNIESHNNNLILKDKVTGWEYRSYPPHSRHYNIKDLLKNIK